MLLVFLKYLFVSQIVDLVISEERFLGSRNHFFYSITFFFISKVQAVLLTLVSSVFDMFLSCYFS